MTVGMPNFHVIILKKESGSHFHRILEETRFSLSLFSHISLAHSYVKQLMTTARLFLGSYSHIATLHVFCV